MEAVLRVTRRELAAEACCAYCRGALDDGALLVDCTRCGATEHAECSREAPRCPTIGCPGRSWRLRPPLRPTGAPPPPPPLAPLTSRLCFTCGVIIDRSALQCGACRPAPRPVEPVETPSSTTPPRSFAGRPLVATQPWPVRPSTTMVCAHEARGRRAGWVADALEVAGLLAALVLGAGAFLGLLLAGAYPDVVSTWVRAAIAGVVGDAGPFVVVIVLGALLTIAGIVVSRRRGPR